MKSYMAKKGDVKQKWVLIDAEGRTLGRLAASIAPILMGKNKPTYTPNVDTGDYVIVTNAEKIKVSGNKDVTKEYAHYTRYPGGYKTTSYRKMLEAHPERIVEFAVKRMLPKSKLGREMLNKLKVYRGSEHGHQAQKPEKIEV